MSKAKKYLVAVLALLCASFGFAELTAWADSQHGWWAGPVFGYSLLAAIVSIVLAYVVGMCWATDEGGL